MAQVATTIRLDSDLKSRFDELCEEFGMSVNTAFSIFAKAVVRTRSIPFAIGVETQVSAAEKGRKTFLELRRQAFGEAFHELRSHAASLQEMTLDEINEEIAAVRAGR